MFDCGWYEYPYSKGTQITSSDAVREVGTHGVEEAPNLLYKGLHEPEKRVQLLLANLLAGKVESLDDLLAIRA